MPASSPVQVPGDLAFTLDERGPGPADGRVLSVALGICLHNLAGGLFDLVGGEHLRRPGVDVGEEAVFAYGQAGRVAVGQYWLISAGLATVESEAAGRVPLELLPAAAADDQARERVTRRLPSDESHRECSAGRRDGCRAGVRRRPAPRARRQVASSTMAG